MALLRVGAAAAIFDVFDGDGGGSAPPPIEEDDETEVSAVDLIEITDQQTVLSTDGDDLINFSQNFNSSAYDGSSFTGGGNSSLVLGGDGSDTFLVVAGTDPRVTRPMVTGGSDADAGRDWDADSHFFEVTTTGFGFNTIPEELLLSLMSSATSSARSKTLL